MPDILNATLNEHGMNYERRQLTWFFGAFSSKSKEFTFLPDEKESILALSTHLKKIIESDDADSFLTLPEASLHQKTLEESVFGSVFGSKGYNFNSFAYFEPNANQEESSGQPNSDLVESGTPNLEIAEPLPTTQTHLQLRKMLKRADINFSRAKPGYRFDEDERRFWTYIRLLAGRLAYSTIHRNYELCIPSLSTTNRYAKNKSKHIHESCLRTNELLEYLEARNLPLIVCISEDATRIDGRIQYDSRSNQIVGFVPPINSANGMPIPHSFPAENYMDFVEHFSNENSSSDNVNVVMVQPLAKFPPFCLLLYGTDSKYTAEDVINRWDFITKELEKVGIEVLIISTDSDPTYNSAHRKKSLLGATSDIFNYDWFRCGLSNNYAGPFTLQDLIHIITKLRNWLLRSNRSIYRYLFGDYYIQTSQLKYLVDNFPRDQHCLTKSCLDPVDRQNYASALRMCSDKVLSLLKSKVPNSEGTITFLKIMRNINDSFSNQNISPLDRIYKIWHALFLVRIWRRFIISKKGLTLTNNFLSANCYSCIEMNAHNLVLIILYLKKKNKSAFFLPFLFNSQPCEEFFRRIRSFTSTYSTKANCSVKEIIERIDKIQLLDDIAIDEKFKFPRVQNAHQFPGQTEYELPSKKEIIECIENCRADAIENAIELGLLEEKYPENCTSCLVSRIEMKPHEPKKASDKKKLVQLNRVTLKNYADKFGDEPVPKTSPYVEIPAGNEKRYIVKKTSLTWVFRPEKGKLSSDRIFRVRGPYKGSNKTNSSTINKVAVSMKKTRKRKNFSLISKTPKNRFAKRNK